MRGPALPGGRRGYLRFSLLLVFLLAVGACAGTIDYRTLETELEAGDCQGALDYVGGHKDAYGENSRLLFYMDRGMTALICNSPAESNQSLQEADRLAEELWTKSISREAAAFLLNDYTRPYAGEDFERALVNLFSALNYLKLENYEEALVEFRRLDIKLTLFNSKYDRKNVYREDAFARYLSGIVYESVGDLDDAYIDYAQSWRVYDDYLKSYGTRRPPGLEEALWRTALAVGRTEEAAELTGGPGPPEGLVTSEELLELGSLLVVQLAGRAPVKREDRLYIPTKYGPVTMAFPRYERRPVRCGPTRLYLEPEGGSAASALSGTTVTGEDITEIAIDNLEDRRGRIVAKTIARAIAKQATVNAATSGMGGGEKSLARLAFNLANLALERADTRSWRTLPAEIRILRVHNPPGRYDLDIEECGGPRKRLKPIELKAGRTEFVLITSMY